MTRTCVDTHALQGGDAVDLGGFLNLVHGRDPDKQIEVEVEMELGDASIPELVPEAFEDWQTGDGDVWDFYEKLQTLRREVKCVSLRLIIGWSEFRETAVVLGYHIGINGEWCMKVTGSKDGRDVSMLMNPRNPIFLYEVEESALLEDFGDWLGENEQTDSSAEPSEEPFSILHGLFYAGKEAGMERPGAGLRTWLTGFNGALPRLDRLLEIPAPGAKGAANVYIAREFTAFLSWLTIGPAMLLREQLQAARYVGPLRRIPPRDFDVSFTKNEAAWSDGMAAWESLLTGSQAMVERCSDWMQQSDRLNTGYGLVRTQVQERDAATGAPCGRIKPRIALMDRNGLTHQPQDVGVGISQVLPVVVAAQDDRASIVSIEQPELHVHPAVQVGLGDLFIEGALERGLSFILETHSEHLILRLLRRIRESAENVDPGLITPNLLGVYHLANENGRITVTALPVNTSGDFDTPWPTGFFDERTAEFFGPAPDDIDEQLNKLFPQ